MEGPSRLAQRLRVGVPVGLAALFAASVAFAQQPSAEDLASARLLGTEGVRLADLGDCAGAVVKLEAAEKLFHAPTTLERLGECQVKGGQIVVGTETLNRVVREPLLPNAPPAFLAARQRAQQALAAALPRIGRLRIHLEGAPADKVTVTVDGVNVPSALFDGDRPTDPGAHEVKATAAGYKVASANVKLDEGAGAAVSLKLEPDPNAVLAPAPPPGASASAAPAPNAQSATGVAPASPAASDTSGTRRGVAFASLGLGGVGVVLGSVFGILALSTKSTLNSMCPSKTDCPSSQQSNISALSTRATVSTVGFVVGVAGIGVGTVLLVTAPSSEKPAAAAAGAPPTSVAKVRVTPWIGLGSAGVGGTFE
jgi:hypothetical protein